MMRSKGIKIRFATLFLLVAGMSSLSAQIGAAEPEISAEQLRFFETSIRPVLVDKCQKCHGAEKQWGQLRLDSREGLFQGGESGAVINTVTPDESRLIVAIQHSDDDLKMPPKEKLADSQIADFQKWARMGFPFPATAATGNARKRDPNHWSFLPMTTPTVPVTAQADQPWDEFILAKIEAAGAEPTPRADRRTLIRRATFDLTGLPPTPHEINEFLADDRPDAYSRLIDRLLASPAYGERWGRHWLDVARYADSNGLDENVAHGNAWRYRDYVIDSFNEDRPYDQFLVEQIAGDLLPAEDDATRSRLLTATGFLALGPKVLAEVDETKMEMDIIDEQIDTVGRAFLGLTFGCARCHDHKFDPIEAADYYALAGIFRSTRTMEHFKKVARWHENMLPSQAARDKKASTETLMTKKKDEIAALIQMAEASLPGDASSNEKGKTNRESSYPEETKKELQRLRGELSTIELSLGDLPSAMGVLEAEPVEVAIHIRGNPLKLGDVVSRRVPKVLARHSNPTIEPTHSGRMELARWMTEPEHPLTSRVMVNRVWRWHFGRGLVRTPDNFGLLGEAPTHPELLDSLSREFANSGWSLKRLHRQLMESSTYQLDSNPTQKLIDADPENRLFARAELRRLEAESIRDSLMAVSDSLDEQIGGSLMKVKNRAYFFDHTSKDLTDYTSQRRSIYLPIVRNNVYDMFQLLDYPDAAVPTGDRSTTTVAPQALLMMNSDFVLNCSADFAKLLLQNPMANDESRVNDAYLRAYGRPPSADELTQSLDYLRKVQQVVSADDAKQQAWRSLCHVILSANEFLYVK